MCQNRRQSRPHPPAPDYKAGFGGTGIIPLDKLQDHDAAIARTATLAAQNDIPGFIDTICFIDLYQYAHNEKDIEDISQCRGQECNYCGKFNERQSTTATGDEQR
jgi:hypothetical protein